MNKHLLNNIANATLRANSRYDLIPYSKLNEQEQASLQSLKDDPDFYGILCPQAANPGLGVKSICRNTAELYQHLQGEPSSLEDLNQVNWDGDTNQAIAQLVLDGILEIKVKDTFVSGPLAHSVIYQHPSISQQKQSSHEPQTISALSEAALRYAQALNLSDPNAISTRLYCYNRVPASQRWQQTWPNTKAVQTYLGLDSGQIVQQQLEKHWYALHSASKNGWLSWQHHQASLNSASPSAQYKLYLSPASEAIAETFASTVDVFTTLKVPCFKVGQDMYGLLRPDKMVAYFPSFEALAETATALADRLSGIPAQGVPFTAAWDDDALLSWGMDPPATAPSLAWQGRESWRLWVTNRLAIALLAGQAAAPTDTASSQQRIIEPWQFAMERLQLDGVNTDTWTPQHSIWS